MDRPECDVILNCHPGWLARAEVDLSLTISYVELSLAINHSLLIEDIDEFPYPEINFELFHPFFGVCFWAIPQGMRRSCS